MSGEVVCISHATGAEGDAVGRAVADKLGLRYVDEEIIHEAAERGDLDATLVADVERRKSLVTRFLESTAEQAVPTRLTTGDVRRSLPTSDDLRELIAAVIRDVADRGGVVIVSHAASLALGGRRDVLRVLITGSESVRAERVGDARDLDARKAKATVTREDSARADYLKRFYDVEREAPTDYDLVVNTDRLTVEKAAELIAAAAA